MSDSEQKPLYRIADMPETERPRERLSALGAAALSEAELIAILLRVGVKGESAVQIGQRLLKDMGGIQGIHRSGLDELCAQHGIGNAKATQIKAAIELGRRLTLVPSEERPAIDSPEKAACLVQYEMSALEQEELRVILLDTRNRALRIETVYRGSLNSSQVRIAELFKAAIRANAAGVIVVHNHPSGDPQPSPEDIAVTRAIVQAGKLLDIDVLDHLVIGRGKWVSLKEKQMGF
jgi:DNA repair protein RadC